MRVPIPPALFAACKVGLFYATLILIAGCGASSTANPASVVGSVVPSSAYELDAFDIQGNYAGCPIHDSFTVMGGVRSPAPPLSP
jgi:hypothetical protein